MASIRKNLDVIAFIADVGQKDELETTKLNAKKWEHQSCS